MSLETAAGIFEYALVAAGLLLGWRLQFSEGARTSRPVRLTGGFSPVAFGTGALGVLAGYFLASIGWSFLIRAFPALRSDPGLSMIIGGTVSHAGILAGLGASWFIIRNLEPPPAAPEPAATPPPVAATGGAHLWPAAFATALITIAVVNPVQAFWQQLLTWFSLPTAKQELVTLFSKSGSPLQTSLLVLSAVVVAPVVEELVFRAGLYRFLRGRLPHWMALLLPSLFFASLHVNHSTLEGLVTLAPLTAFGVIFSLAYERTGRLSVIIVAHGLFNLHTVVFLLLGLTD